eukprot:TRINITY_DN5164_c0_g1_i10.p1 TRINITY_DN5164_c0_g1~~TRINITY_DN5164_c0_g1_i10.p1  ORF type:complete len:155 (+),score=12.57 TRINITY_DN5164_c0_g1_i10:661-1125(+)
MNRKDLILVKIGGAAITDKNKEETLNYANLGNLVNLFSNLHSKFSFVIVHGAGSFGHIQVAKSPVEHSPLAACLVHQLVTKLSYIVSSMLIEANIPAVVCSPMLSWQTSTEEKNKVVLKHNCCTIKQMLAEGLVPVLHGDVVFDEKTSFSILSG